MTRLLKGLLILVISTQMSFADKAIIQSYSKALKQWDQQFRKALYQSVTTRMNKLLARPDQLKKHVHQNLKFSRKNRQLFNADFAKVGRKRLREIRVEFNNGQHTVTTFRGRKLVLNLGTMPKGFITVNGHKFSLQGFHDYQKIRKFFQQKYTGQQMPFSNLMIPAAYAKIEMMDLLNVVLGLAFAVFLAVLLGVFDDLSGGTQGRELQQELDQYEKYFREALAKCKTDKETIVQGDQLRIISNDTTIFIQQIEKYYQSKADKKEDKQGQIMSCESTKNYFKKIIEGSPLVGEVHKLCGLIQHLQECLDRTKELIKKKKLIINNQGRYQDEHTIRSYSPYQGVMDIMEGRKILQ